MELPDYDHENYEKREERQSAAPASVYYLTDRKRKNKFERKLAILIILSLLVGAFLGAAIGPKISDRFDLDKPVRPLLPTPPKIVKNKAKSEDELLVSTINDLRPSVVNIRTKSGFKHPGGLFFGDPEKTQGIGSGVIIREDGYIVTNQHVIEDANEITVNFYDGSEGKAKIIGQDAEADIAVIKIYSPGNKKLKAAPVGSSSQLKVGSTVLALGSPWELEDSVTAGIVSALNRKINVDGQNGEKKFYPDLIQTDAAINPGNSGGALSDKYGNVIGINTLIYSESGGYEGIGFAIPIEHAISAAEQLISKGKVSHPYIGVIGQDTNSDDDREEAQKGALLVEVRPKSPASKAGMRIGDVILSINGQKVKNMDDLIAEIRLKKIGTTVTLTFKRGHKINNTKIKIIDKPSRKL